MSETDVKYTESSPPILSFTCFLHNHTQPPSNTLPTMSAPLPPPRLYNTQTDTHLLPQLARIHAACIMQDAQLATFLPPLNLETIETYWRHLASKAGVTPTMGGGEGVEVCLQMAPAEDGKGEVVAGYVVLSMAWSETGPFRGEVLKLMVSPEFRRKGVARRVMGLLEEVARERGRGLLVSVYFLSLFA